MNNHVRKQHFVPQLLLKHFLNKKNLVWCYDKKWKKISEKGTGAVAFEDYFYDTIPGIKDNSLEYKFQKLETDAAPILQKIITTRNLKELSLQEKSTAAFFIALQMHRTKSALNETGNFSKQYMERITDWLKEVNPNIEVETLPAKQLWFSSFENANEFSGILENKAWMLFEADSKFYTSDHPVVMQNTAYQHIAPYRGVLGINSEGIEIYFPLNPSLVLGLRCERKYKHMDMAKFQCNAANVENINHLQVYYAERYVFAVTDDFWLVEDMVRKGECK